MCHKNYDLLKQACNHLLRDIFNIYEGDVIGDLLHRPSDMEFFHMLNSGFGYTEKPSDIENFGAHFVEIWKDGFLWHKDFWMLQFFRIRLLETEDFNTGKKKIILNYLLSPI